MRAAFLDRDGVINLDLGYVYRQEDFRFVPGALQACRVLSESGLGLFVVTNQSGIGRGLFTEEDFRSITRYMCDELGRAGAPVLKVYHCPHHPEAKIARYRVACECRKPKPGMILEAAREFGVDLASSVLFGDSPRDIEAGSAAGVGERVILGRDGLDEPETLPRGATAGFRNLLDAVRSPWFQKFLQRPTS